MTESVVQMGRDVGRMSLNMEGMAVNMNQMAKSMVEGQARMGDDFSACASAWSPTHNTANMSRDMGEAESEHRR